MARYTQDPIAIVGFACRLPGDCNTPKEFWDFLEKGGIASLLPPATRFSLPTHHDGSKKPGTMASPGGMFINADPRDIDAPFFKLSKTEAISMDPQQRQLLEVVYEGLENSGITLDEVNNTSVGCFVSSYACDYADIQARDPENRAPAATVGIGRAMFSNRISHFLNIKGPSMTVDTACSGSLVGADIAIRYLQTGEINGAIVAGCNMYLSPEHVMDSMSANGTASATGRCHTFDAKANGYIKSEAVNMIFLKRLDDAMRDGNPIRAVIRGSATGSDGWTAGIASPNAQAQAATIRQAYRNANIENLAETSYVECHGTGTRAGDAIEVDGVASVFSASRTEDLPLQIGSVKSNIGHSEPAAGISSVLKVILSMEKGIIPGNPTFEDPNPNINFDSIKLRPSRTNRRWRIPTKSRRAGVNSFGYGGSNVHLIMDSAEGMSNHKSSYIDEDEDMFDLNDDTDMPDRARPYLIPFSGNDERSMKDYTSALDRHLSNPAVRISFRDLAYTLSEKRTHHFHRGYAVVSSKGKFDPRTLVMGKKSSTSPRIGLVFTGQGAQWPQMGKDLIATFPIAKTRLAYLDTVLRALPDGPEWSLLEELSVPRTPEFYKQPELSQTLVTALQLALLAVLESTGFSYHTVVGHSSGEIAGAVAAGQITAEDAIRIAYHRGVATTAGTAADTKGALGMMAIGVGEEAANEYCASCSNVQVACVNSPRSVTLSGDRAELQLLERKITQEGHFARLLAVDAAYHSKYMMDAAAQYRTLILEHCAWEQQQASKEVSMYSSVTGHQAEGDVKNPEYWEKNMVQPVLFSAAVTTLLQSEELDMLIEIGPSGALAGPIKHILQSTSSSVQYFPAWKRGPDALITLFDTVGNLFIRGMPLNLSKFNEDVDPQAPSTIVDLPNYCWNHSTKYWYESRASKDWRFRKFLRHDLLGSKVLSTPWTQPTWQNTLRIQDVPWLRDHRLGESIVFPAAAYVSMAIEAMFQMAKATGLIADENSNVAQPTYQLRNVKFLKAMILEDGGADNHLVLTLSPLHGSNETWYTFNVLSMLDNITNTHSTGLIRIGAYHPVQPSPTDLQPLQYSTPANIWYKSMKDVGYSFGPSFQKQLEIECIAGQRKGRSLINLHEPASLHKQSAYPLHPVVIDGCFQTSSAPIWKGDRSAIHTVLVPKMIDELIIPSQPAFTADGLAVSQAIFVGPGREDNPTSFSSNVLVFDSKSSTCVFHMRGLTFSGLERSAVASDAHVYNKLVWNPDPSFCSQTELKQLLMNAFDCTSTESGLLQRVNKLCDMIAFKNPEVKVLEIHAGDAQSSLWSEGRKESPDSFDRTRGSSLHIHTVAAKPLTTQQDAISRHGAAVGNNISTSYSDSLDTASDLASQGPFDIVLVKSSFDPLGLLKTIRKVRSFLRPKGYFLLFNSTPEGIASDAYGDLISLAVARSTGFEAPPVLSSLPSIPGLQDGMSQFVFGIADGSDGSSLGTNTILDKETNVSVACFSEQASPHAGLDSFLNALSASATSGMWTFETHTLPFSTIAPNSIVLIVEELFATFLSSVSSDAWTALQSLVQNGCRILWVTSGSQMSVTNPKRSLIHGLARSICNENPDCVFMTLDVASGSAQNAVRSIKQILRRLKDAKTSKDTDTEFVERNGVIHVGRVMLDECVNAQEKANVDGPNAEPRSLFEQDATVRLICERPGFLDSLTYVSIPDSENTLQQGHVEVDIHAVSLNFKDVAISMNLVPGNEHLLGLEGAGTVRRVGDGIDPSWIGRRVVVNRKGSLANRVHGRLEGEIHVIPDWLSFNDASTLTTVFSTVIYSLFDLANTQRGQSVLIHSAAGGVGLAAIQVCRYLGAEIYATTSSEAKKVFLVNEMGIPADRILSSRSVEDFEPALMQLTSGKGVDVVLNSLTGEMLHASWRCIATSGTFIEIGKKDIIDRASISMEPFNRNASYRAVDMSHECISFPLKARLLTQMFDLIEKGHIEPVHVSKTFAFNDVHAAFRYMRSGTNIGKTVIGRGIQGEDDDVVPIRPLKQTLSLDQDASYLIVGGLKGLCGSLATFLARKGATNITVLSRSGYDDNKSQAIIRDINALGANVDLVVGDVTDVEAVKGAFVNASKPIRGIIQGAMVLRDKMYDSMTSEDFSTALSAKVMGTWNLHNVALELDIPLNFFTLLSSICGVAGQKGQANYSAANAFLDSFAVYRHALGLPASSVDLGVIEDVGYVNERETLGKRLLAQGWIPIGEALLHRILTLSILQQRSVPPNQDSATQLITGIPFPLPKESPAQRDPRFSHLRKSAKANNAEDGGTDDSSNHSLLATLKGAWKSPSDASTKHPQLIDIVVNLAGARLTRSLGMDEEMDAARPLASYGIDSLVAVEFRNWARTELEVEVSTLEIVGGKTLAALAEVIVKKGFERMG